MVIDLPGAPLPSGTGLSQVIVRLLQDYKRSLPIDFVASVLGRSKRDILPELQDLEEHGAVHCNGDFVGLGKK